MKNILIVLAVVVGLSGCTGVVTGHQYTLEDVQKAEKAYIKAKEAYGIIEKEKNRIDAEGFSVPID